MQVRAALPHQGGRVDGQHHDPDVLETLLDLAQHLETVDFGHMQVEQHHLGLPPLDFSDRYLLYRLPG